MGPPPLHLDYARNTYLVLSSSSASAPPLPTSSAPGDAHLVYAGALGPGALEKEHVYALQGVPSGAHAAEDRELVERARAVLRGLGVGTVEVMQPKMRAKR